MQGGHNPEKRNANLVHLKSAIFDGRWWSLSEKSLGNSDITLMLDLHASISFRISAFIQIDN